MGVIHIQRSCRHCGAQTFADWVLCRWKCPELPDPGAVGKSTVTYEIGQASALLSVLQSYGGHIPVGAAAAHRNLPAKRMRPSPSRYQRTQSDAEETGTARLVRRSIELVLINGSQSQLLREHHSGTLALGHRWGGRAWLQIDSMSWPWRSVCQTQTASPASKLAQTYATASPPTSWLVKRIETTD